MEECTGADVAEGIAEVARPGLIAHQTAEQTLAHATDASVDGALEAARQDSLAGPAKGLLDGGPNAACVLGLGDPLHELCSTDVSNDEESALDGCTDTVHQGVHAVEVIALALDGLVDTDLERSRCDHGGGDGPCISTERRNERSGCRASSENRGRNAHDGDGDLRGPLRERGLGLPNLLGGVLGVVLRIPQARLLFLRDFSVLVGLVVGHLVVSPGLVGVLSGV